MYELTLEYCSAVYEMHIYIRFIRSEFLLLIPLFLINKLRVGFITVVTSLSGKGGTSLRIIIIDNTELLYCTVAIA